MIGSETLRDLLEHCVPESKTDMVQWRYDRTSNVSGISGNPEATLGEVSIPLCLSGADGSYKADVLGGEGSLCPALLSNPALRKQKAAILSDYFQSGDGVMAVRAHDDDDWHYLRLLLTDSGHYLLPADDKREVSDHTKGAVRKQLYTWANEIRQRWSDVRHCFLSETHSPTCRERERCEGSPNTSCTTSVTSSTSVPDTSCTTSGTSSTSVPDTSCTTSGKPFLDGPSAKKATLKSDQWIIEQDNLVRLHHVPRRALFTPQCVTGCPISLDWLSGSRTTTITPVSRQAALKVLSDDFAKATIPNRDLEYLWTGRTTFPLRTPNMASFISMTASPPTSESPSACSTLSQAGELDPQEFPRYGGDEFSDHWPEERRVKAKHYYKAIPEEFYTKSGRRVIKPKNVEKWLQQTSSHKGLRWRFQEMCSGSGRLSLLLMLTGMIVGFPVDYRYGWDIGHAPHQVLLQRCYSTFEPEHIFGAPSCGPWSCSSSSKDPHSRAADRQAEMPTLHFLSETFLRQCNHGRGFTLEQPFSSAMFHHEPISHLVALEEVRRQRLDQCMHGAVDELNMPVRKATALLSNRKFKVSLKRCDGHRNKAHGILQGQYKGCDRAALAAVYPKKAVSTAGSGSVAFSSSNWTSQVGSLAAALVARGHLLRL